MYHDDDHDNDIDNDDHDRIADANLPVGACAVLAWWFIGTTYCWGVLQSALVDQGLASASTLAFCRLVDCISLMGLGEILSGFSTHNVAGLFICTGLIMGIGVSICFITASTTTAQYFSKKRGIANGFLSAVGGLGGALTAIAMDKLEDKLGPAWTFRVLGLMTFGTGLPAAWFVMESAPINPKRFIECPHFYNIGLSKGTGAGLVAGFNFASAVRRIGCGFLSDAVGPLNTLFVSFAMFALWPVSQTLAPLVAFVIINGGFFATMPTVVGNVFGSARVSVAMTMIVSSWGGGYLLGAPIAGFMLKAYGGEEGGFKAYRPAVFFAGSMSLAAACLCSFKH
ncbi:uncharacterized protein K452DRAFT_348313 [Aplosporella prunicola CBS 121167]|uniref:Major facilitator superfamily (MFS) profile domain-containing protein n=1 Tax=Aplosporella prunicola CBS 121167 TaxID=1176127 RepID=A0A6A6BR46_9PEZI|nr:uncharacterized protein K452DRAFT_348313 [Aplosporella prunicola CBS 121167]KAF2146556.1 hypothetical protein K452DRAFT_348313 [Aplosporella prunicola CBS 121167]